MAKKTINFRVSAATESKLVELSLRTGMLKTEILSIAIDRMYREELKMNDDFGTVIYEGREYRLDEQATLSNNAFPGWWGDVEDGEGYTAEYCARATADAQSYIIYWQFDVIKGNEPEDEGDYPWDDDHIAQIVEQ